MRKKIWKVNERYSDSTGTFLEFCVGGEIGWELSPAPYFHGAAVTEALKNGKPLCLYPRDIGYREACLELSSRYGGDWNVTLNPD